MNSFWDKLNLRPQERRLVVAVGVVVFVVLNIWFVWPHFKDWKIIQIDHEKAKKELLAYEKEIARIPSFEAKLRELELAGPSVVPEEQELDLVRTVQGQTVLNNISVQQSDPRPKTSNTRTNQFFEEQTLNMRIEAGNEELVNFLVSLASTNSLIRVQEMSLQPSPNGYKLSGNLTLVASYQKKPPPKLAASTTPTNAVAAAKPSTSPTKKAGSASAGNPVAATKGTSKGTSPSKPLPSK